jgi:hypothetical protein
MEIPAITPPEIVPFLCESVTGGAEGVGSRGLAVRDERPDGREAVGTPAAVRGETADGAEVTEPTGERLAIRDSAGMGDRVEIGELVDIRV